MRIALPTATESTSHRHLSPRASLSPKDGCKMSRRRAPGLCRGRGGTVGSFKPLRCACHHVTAVDPLNCVRGPQSEFRLTHTLNRGLRGSTGHSVPRYPPGSSGQVLDLDLTPGSSGANGSFNATGILTDVDSHACLSKSPVCRWLLIPTPQSSTAANPVAATRIMFT